MITDYGMKDNFSIFLDLTEKVLQMPYDFDTMHDVKNLISYMWMRPFKMEVN